MRFFSRLFELAAFAACAGMIAAVVIVLSNTYFFEYPYIFELLGFGGVALAAFILGVAIYMLVRSAKALRDRAYLIPRSLPGKIVIILWVLSILWVGDWVLLTQAPLTARLQGNPSDADRAEVLNAAGKRALPTGVSPAVAADPARRAQFGVMLDRIALNRPKDYSAGSIVQLAEKYGAKYHVNPVLTYYWLYLCSFYGEAPAGRVPFTRAMTSETIRDFVQAHLPTFMVEGDWRRKLIEGQTLDGKKFLGHDGHDWKYAVQKATYDVSVEPFDTNVYTDVFLVLREFHGEFPELFAPAGEAAAIDRELGNAFTELEPVFMTRPYSGYYEQHAWTAEQYDRYRRPLKTFARAAFYKMTLDLDFATRVQTLVARYYMDQYRAQLGDAWDRLGEAKQVSLVAMLRDVYMPNIGKLSGNDYNLPEFNLAPFFFLAGEAKRDEAALVSSPDIWRPRDVTKLWSAADAKLRVLSEVWRTYYGAALPGVIPTETLKSAEDVVVRELH